MSTITTTTRKPKQFLIKKSINEREIDDCREKILEKFETFLNKFSSGWKYHILNTKIIQDLWNNFEDFYNNLCYKIFISDNNNNDIDNDDDKEVIRTKEFCEEKLLEKVDNFIEKFKPNWKSLLNNNSDLFNLWVDFQQYFIDICLSDQRGERAFFNFFFFLF